MKNGITYPAKVQLIAAMNPCRCGYLNDIDRSCNRAPRCGVDYQSKISGPLMDRMDIKIDVSEVPVLDLQNIKKGESSDIIAKRVAAARLIQEKRYISHDLTTNSEISGQL